MKIDICICTFRRPFVVETLKSIEQAQHPDGVALRLIVIDNDDTPTAQERVETVAQTLSLPVLYRHEPGRNISIARNAALAAADADWIAFLDDDERVDPDWLIALMKTQADTQADAVFGHSRACYDDIAPDWIVKGDFHSQFAAPRGDVVETGHTCNALLRWSDAPWRHERFDLNRGRSGGEDTEFFFRLRRMGAVYAISDTAIVREEVPAHRLNLKWLLSRRFRIGQSYAASATSGGQRLRLFFSAAAKSAYCYLRAGTAYPKKDRRAFWLMRATMHAGVCAGCLKLRQSTLYGQ